MSNFNEENLRKYCPHLYANTSTPSGEEITRQYIIEKKPSVNVVRKFYREKVAIIQEKRDKAEEEELNEI